MSKLLVYWIIIVVLLSVSLLSHAYPSAMYMATFQDGSKVFLYYPSCVLDAKEVNCFEFGHPFSTEHFSGVVALEILVRDQ